MHATQHSNGTQPERNAHLVESFSSGNSQLDNWLRNRALKNEQEGASRTYIVCVETVVVGYYCLANGAVTRIQAVRKVKRTIAKINDLQ